MSRWPTRPLSQLISTLETGSRPKGGVSQIPDGIPSLGGEHITRDGGFSWSNPKHVSRDFYAAMRRGRIQREDILIVKDGATTGKTAMVRDNFPFSEASINEHVFLLRVDKAVVLPAFVGYFLFSSVGQQQILSSYRGAAIGGIGQDFVRNVHVPLPPMSVQERIAQLLGEAEKLRKLRAQAERRTAELLPSIFNDMFSRSRSQSIDFAPLAQLADVVSGVAKGRRFNGRVPVQAPYLRVANVQAGHLDLAEIKTIDALPEEVEELSLRKGDVLLTEGGDYDKLGRGAMLDEDLPGCIHQNHVFRVRVNQSQLDPVFFAGFLQTDEARSYFLRCAKRTTNLASINMTQLRALPVPKPPLAMQQEYTKQAMGVKGLVVEQVASRQHLQALFNSMLHHAFQGQL